MGRSKKNPRLEVQLLKALSETEDGKRYEELFKELKPGSKTTYTEVLHTLAVANFIEFLYPSKRFKITERGLEAIRPVVNNLRAMDFLVNSGILADKQEAVRAAIEFALGNYSGLRGVDIRLIMPLQIDTKGNLNGLPSNAKEWEKRERDLGLARKISHDAEEELISELQLFCKKYPVDSYLALRSTQSPTELQEQIWPREVAGAMILLFFTDPSMAKNSLPILKKYLSKYKSFKSDKLNKGLIEKIHGSRANRRRS